MKRMLSAYAQLGCNLFCAMSGPVQCAVCFVECGYCVQLVTLQSVQYPPVSKCNAAESCASLLSMCVT